MSVVSGERLFGRRAVQAARLQDEAQLLDGRRRGELPDAAQRKGHFVLGFVSCASVSQVEQHFVVAPCVDEVGVPSGDHRRGAVVVGLSFDLDIEFLVDTLLERDGDAPLVDEAAPFGDGLGRHVAQHFEPVFRTAHQCPERHGDRQPDHPRAGNSHAHGVFEDVGAQTYVDPLGATAEQFGGACRAERYGDRFGAADRGHDFAADQLDDAATFGGWYHAFRFLRVV